MSTIICVEGNFTGEMGYKVLEGCEEEQSFWKLYIQMVFGTNFML
tara:strand:- start:97 stop:231 length:135 start_codon:yes stop_codon:yes gene_type:complete